MKRERPATFFDDEEEEDYLIEASLESKKENDLVGFDDFMSQKPTTVKPGNDKKTTSEIKKTNNLKSSSFNFFKHVKFYWKHWL